MLVVFALAGLIGQTTAHATPFQVFASQQAEASSKMDCADMPGMSRSQPATPDGACKGMTASCIGKMGCATVATPLPTAAIVAASVAYDHLTFLRADQGREGVNPPPLETPPIRRA